MPKRIARFSAVAAVLVCVFLQLPSLHAATRARTPLSITTTSLPKGTLGTSYSTKLAATGGTTPYSWSITSGTLPAGLTLSTSGTLGGTPTALANAVSLTFKVTDSSQSVQTKSVTLTLTIAQKALAITTTSLPSGQVGALYSAALAATGGTSPYTWSLTSGTLPAGLSLSTSGALSGTPTAAANFVSLTFKVTDSSQTVQTKSATLFLTIAAKPLTITTTSLPSGQVGAAYSTSLEASGGTTPYTWSLTSGTLPSGLSLSTSGLLSGTPSAVANAVSLTFRVRDSSSSVQTKSATLALTIAPKPLVITTASLPAGQVGVAYSATLAATGGKTPYTWSLSAGTLPAGLTLSAAGAISGNPTTPGTFSGISFQAKDSSAPALTTTSAPFAVTINPVPLAVAVSPKNAGLAVSQALSLSATTTDSSSVNWSVTGTGCSGVACGTFSAPTSTSGSPITYTAPTTPGQYTITAADVNNSAVVANVTVGVTDLAAVATYHNNNSRSGVNSQEYVLAPANVKTGTFGKLFSCPVDGAIYAEPLWVPNLTIGGAQHNVVFVATQHDSLYAFDADKTPCTTLWSVSLIDTAHGGAAGEKAVPSSLVGNGYGDIEPEVGVTGTPVIDPVSRSLYVVSKSVDATATNFFQRLHAIDLLTGSEKLVTGPALIAGTFPAIGGTVAFSARQENQRPGLALVNGVVYIAWAAHEDLDPWYGWVMGYDATTLAHLYTFNSTPNTSQGGIWMGGGAPSADSSGNLYVITGNGDFDANSLTAPKNDYGDSFLQLTGSLAVTQYFTPSNQASDNSQDQDFGSGGTSVVVDLPANGKLPNHLVIGGGKDGYLCLLNRDALGGYSDTNSGAVQMLNFGNGIFGTPAFWNWSFYLAGESGKLQQYSLNQSTYLINATPTSTSSMTYGFPGATPLITAKPDNSNAILWALDNTQYCTPESPGCGPAVLHAYDATNLATEFWNSAQGTGNSAGFAVKFTLPTIANGKAYVPTRGNDADQTGVTPTIPGELDVYGLLPN